MKNMPFFTLYKKEIMDLLRDKKTIIVMILIPLFLYPTMMIGSLLITTGLTKEAVEKEKGLYEENLAALVNGYIRML